MKSVKFILKFRTLRVKISGLLSQTDVSLTNPYVGGLTLHVTRCKLSL